MRDALFVGQVNRAHVCLGVKAIGHYAAIRDFADQRLNLGVIGATDRNAIKRDVRDEIIKPFAQVFDCAPVFHVFGVDIGHNRDRRRQSVKRAVGFIRLDNHPFAIPDAGVRSIGMDDTAVHNSGVEIAVIQQRGHHRGSRGFAVRPRNRDVGLEPHQFGQHFCTAHNRQTAAARLVQFGVAGLDG